MTTSTEPAIASVRRLIVSVSSLPSAFAFYTELLGLTLRRRADGFAWLGTADGVEILLHERPARSSDAGVAIGFLVTELGAVVTAWEARGGVVVDPPARQPWGEEMAVVRDPDGHLVCLSAAADRSVDPDGA